MKKLVFALLFCATSAFAGDAMRSGMHLVKIEPSNGASRQYNVQVFDAETRSQIAHLKVAGTEGETTANGVTYAVRVQTMGEAYIVDFTARNTDEVIDTMRAAFTTKAKPAPVAPKSVRGGREVDEAKAIRKIDAVYTEDAKAAGAAGSVIVEVTIDKSGFVRDAKVVKAMGYGLSESAIDAVKQWQFEVTLQDRVPVEVVQEVTVEFKP